MRVGVEDAPERFLEFVAFAKDSVAAEFYRVGIYRLGIPGFDPEALAFGAEKRKSSVGGAREGEAARAGDLLGWHGFSFLNGNR